MIMTPVKVERQAGRYNSNTLETRDQHVGRWSVSESKLMFKLTKLTFSKTEDFTLLFDRLQVIEYVKGVQNVHASKNIYVELHTAAARAMGMLLMIRSPRSASRCNERALTIES
jgi:hypothetical protein